MAENLVRLFVVRVADVGDGDEYFEGGLLVGFADAALDIALDFCFALFSVTVREALISSLHHVRHK